MASFGRLIGSVGAVPIQRGNPRAGMRTWIESLSGGEVNITIDLNLGGASATAWGCDLSAEYVAINSEYTT